ncbi:tetratricopeptide repeat protein [Aquimarina litoralis]|uniref:Tetratricopeptide repeat protein n=1 Tax=Aquimarina litoralis TaxID=584605 RepID=A0ABN1IFR9_9FLAO
MNAKELTYLFQNPSLITKEHTENLEKIIQEFPYFQPVRALILKGLKQNEDFRYNQELKTTAAYTTDRAVLFDFITSKLFDSTSQDTVQKKNKNDIDVVGAQEIKALSRISMDDAVDMNIEEAEEVLDPSLFSSKDTPIDNNVTMTEMIIEQSEKDEIHEVPEEGRKAFETVLEIDKPLNFDKKESHSFAEWLKLTSTLPIDRTNETTINSEDQYQQTENEKPNEQEHKFHLIDEFIANNPKIKPAEKNAPSRNLANEHMVAPDELMTETLARVYLAQKKYKKAIQAYKILILKNPEKSGFFADQIRAIKKLQENK